MSSLMIILRHSIFLRSCQGHFKRWPCPWVLVLVLVTRFVWISDLQKKVECQIDATTQLENNGSWSFHRKGSKNTKYSWHSMQCMLIWGTWNFKIRYIANVISCGFATPRDSAEIDILLKALLVPVWTVTCSYIILCMQQLHQYASLSFKVSDTAYESLPESIVNGNGQAEPRIRIHNMVIWLKWFSQKKHMNWRNIPWLLRLIKPGYRNPSCAQLTFISCRENPK